MISTNLITFEVSFINTTETVIFNTSVDSMNDLAIYLNDKSYFFDKAKEYSKKDSKFKTVNKQRFSDCINYNTELIKLFFNK